MVAWDLSYYLTLVKEKQHANVEISRIVKNFFNCHRTKQSFVRVEVVVWHGHFRSPIYYA